MIDTGDIKNIKTRYQYQYQYCRIQNSISISIPIPKMIKCKLNLKTIPRYLDILRSQANTQKIRASIAQLWFIHPNHTKNWELCRLLPVLSFLILKLMWHQDGVWLFI